jgi:hypothetical protein
MWSISASKREYQQRKSTVWPVLRYRTLHKNSRRIMQSIFSLAARRQQV